jgi:hypothetical protein
MSIVNSKNRTLMYIIAFLVVVIAFILLGGGDWIKGLSHGNRSVGMGNLQWVQIVISLAIGFVIGLLVGKRRW